jgi:hypothetical protein
MDDAAIEFNLEPWQIEEIDKCRQSFEYFASKYIFITHPKRGLVNFNMYPYQHRMVGDYNKYRFNLISKFRQGGATTTTVLWCMWRCLFMCDQKILVVSIGDREAIGAGKMVKTALENLPPWMQPHMGKNNDHEKEFADTNSVIYFYSPKAARSMALTLLVIDEAAFIVKMDELWAAMMPTLATGGSCVVISTVNGMGNWYEQMYHTAIEGKNDFHVIDIDYKEHPDYCHPDFAPKMRANLGEKRWLQEFERNFLGTGETYIPTDRLAELSKATRYDEPIRRVFPDWDRIREEFKPESEASVDLKLSKKEYIGGAMWVWAEPIKNREYMLVADASEGVGEGGDFSAFHVIDLHECEQVAEFYSDEVKPHLFAQTIAQIGLYYNAALVVVENMGAGSTVLNRLQYTFDYENLYYDKDDRPGMRVGPQNRPLILEALQFAISNRSLKLHGRRTVYELNTFIYNKARRKAEAQKGKHDDLVMSLALGMYIRDEHYRRLPVGADKIVADLSPTEYQTNIRDQIRKAILEDAGQGFPDDFDTKRPDFGLLTDPAGVTEKTITPDMLFDWRRPKIYQEFGF